MIEARDRQGIRACGRHHLGRQRGLSLVELMVSLLIAVLVLGAVMVTLSGTSVSSRRQDASGRLNDEGQLALNLLSSYLRMSGSMVPRAAYAGNDNHFVPGRAVLPFGCRNGFADSTVAFPALACAGGGGNDGIAVRYEVDVDSSPAAVGGVPTDCLGQPIPAAARQLVAGVGLVWVADNRFFVANNPDTGNPALFCRGAGGGNAQVLVDNIETLRVRYGLLRQAAIPYPKADRPGWEIAYTDTVAEYVDADAAQLTLAAGGITDPRDMWRRVGAMNVCLVIRTADNVADQPTPFLDCNGNVTVPGDRRLRKAMFSTIALRNSGAPGITLAP